jgi:hypothetical protein
MSATALPAPVHGALVGMGWIIGGVLVIGALKSTVQSLADRGVSKTMLVLGAMAGALYYSLDSTPNPDVLEIRGRQYVIGKR